MANKEIVYVETEPDQWEPEQPEKKRDRLGELLFHVFIGFPITMLLINLDKVLGW